MMENAAAHVPATELLRLTDAIGQTATTPLSPAAVASLRRRFPAAVAALIVAIAAEQRRAREKFGPGLWMVSAKAIRQATDRVVATYKASLLSNRPVFDLCGGVGGDAMAFACRGSVVTIDCDSQVTAMAAANLQLARQQLAADCPSTAAPSTATSGQAIAVCADVTRYRIPDRVAIHIDPDRRPNQQRTVRPEGYLPPLEFVQTLIAKHTASIVKLAPAAELIAETDGQDLTRRHHRQWISLDLSVREQTLLCGEAIEAAGVAAGGRSAVRLLRNGMLERFAIGPKEVERLVHDAICCDITHLPPAYLFDFDPAIRGSGLSTALAESRGLAAIGTPAGFFGSSSLPEDRSLMQCFETLWSGPADRKQIQRELRKHDWSLQSVKVRGSDHDPAKLQRELQPDKRKSPAGTATTPTAVTLLIGRHARGVYAVLARTISATA